MRDRALALTLALASGAGLLAYRLGDGLWGALGSDAPVWGLSALDLGVGPLAPPLYPALIAALHTAGLSLVTAGWSLSLLAAALVPAATFLAARAAGASRGWALAGGLVVALSPDLGGWAQQVQPDSLLALALVTLAGLLARDQGWSVAVLAGLLPLLREHGLLLAPLVTLALLWRRRWGPAALVVALAWGLPWLVYQGPPPWSGRAGGALAALLHPKNADLSYIIELHRPERQAYRALAFAGDRLGMIRWHAARSLTLAWDGWLWLAAAGLGAALHPRPRRLALPLLATLPALLIWSQRRHVLALLPVAVAVVASTPRLRVGALLLLALPWLPRWPVLARAQASERPRAEHFARIGGWLCANAPTGSLLGGVFQDVGLYCPLPRHDPDDSAADGATFWVTDRPPPAPWAQVFEGAGPMRVYHLPDTTCPGGHPAPGARHLVAGPAHADMVGCLDN